MSPGDVPEAGGSHDPPGRGELRVDCEPHPLEPGVCAVVEPGERHELACTGAEELVLLYFGVEG
ncbi:MAG TPA: cupin domain-containing protein [Longimicrobiaceae bacterium]|nr:cupin domain-containing protein [Longimicrobiaceae bacterium]